MKLLCVIFFLSFCGSIHSGLPIFKFGKLHAGVEVATVAGLFGQLLVGAPTIGLINFLSTRNEDREDVVVRDAARIAAQNLRSILAEREVKRVKTDETDDEEEDENSPCIIKVNDLPSRHPNFIQLFDIKIPLKGLLTFQKKESFKVDCVQSTFSNGVSIKNVVCDGNNKYKIDGRTVDLSAFNTCQKRIKVIAVHTGNPCLVGLMTDMVFELPIRNFKLYSACIDSKSSSTLYVHYKLYGRALDGSPIVRDGSYFQGGGIFDALFKMNEEFQKGHLMPFADAIYPAWRAETNNYMNVNPQFPALNTGAWKTLEQTIRNKAIGTSETLDVYTGGLDLKGFLDGFLQIFRTDNLWYKMVINKNRGIVFVACNDDQRSCLYQLEKICTNKCIEIGWLTTKAHDKIICCSITDFYKSGKIAVIPGTETVTEDMFFYRN